MISTLCLASTLLVPSQAQSNLPNIVWVLSEDIGPQLSCYGEKQVRTPRIDKFASRSGAILRGSEGRRRALRSAKRPLGDDQSREREEAPGHAGRDAETHAVVVRFDPRSFGIEGIANLGTWHCLG
jgi:hypothetical protein